MRSPDKNDKTASGKHAGRDAVAARSAQDAKAAKVSRDAVAARFARDAVAARLARDAMLLGAALILSYLESFIPMPRAVPGVKLGLANIAVILCGYLVSLPDAWAVSALRIVISSLLFGSVTSLWFSLTGGMFALAALTLLLKTPARDKVSPIGVSVACAASHNTGQIAAACAVFGNAGIFRYLPALLLFSAVFGLVTGIAADRVIHAARSIKKT